MSRNENDPRKRNFRRVERLNYAKTIHPGHLYIKKNQIWPLLSDCRHGRLATVSFACNLHS